jgi:hypothetical protein
MKTPKTMLPLLASILLLSPGCSHKDSCPFSVQNNFVASGYMGDNEKIQVVLNNDENCRTAKPCIRIEYTPGDKGFGGVYWQHPANNWCKEKGWDLSDSTYSKITFWAKGKTGKEIIKFKAGQTCGDSFVTNDQDESLTTQWTQYTIDIKGQNLSIITGGFAFIVDSHQNSGASTVFYLDDIKYE